MKKYMLLLLFIVLCSGCTMNYEMEIYNNKVNESIDIYEDKSSSLEDSKTKIENIIHDDSFMAVDRQFLYNKKASNEFYTYTANESFNFSDYSKKLQDVDRYCRATRFVDDGTFIEFKLYGYLKVFEDPQYEKLDEIKFTIKSNHKVKEHNADEKHGYSYTWNIDRYNYKDKIPYIKLYSQKKVFDYEGIIKKYIIGCLIIILIAGLIIGIVAFSIMRKGQNANRI